MQLNHLQLQAKAFIGYRHLPKKKQSMPTVSIKQLYIDGVALDQIAEIKKLSVHHLQKELTKLFDANEITRRKPRPETFDLNIKTEATRLRKSGSSLKNVIAWVKKKTGRDVTAPSVTHWAQSKAVIAELAKDDQQPLHAKSA